MKEVIQVYRYLQKEIDALHEECEGLDEYLHSKALSFLYYLISDLEAAQCDILTAAAAQRALDWEKWDGDRREGYIKLHAEEDSIEDLCKEGIE